MSVAIVLPARLKSTRLPNKLLLSATGKTLLEHTIDRAKLAQAKYPKLFTTIRVACDDEQLIAAAKRAGVDAVMTSPDHQSGTDRIAEAAQDLNEDIVVNLQADEPEIDPTYIHTVAQVLSFPDVTQSKLKASNSPNPPSMATLATYIFDEATFRNPNVVKVIPSETGGRALYFSRAPIPYSRDGKAFAQSKEGKAILGFHHIGMYAYYRRFLYEFVQLKPSRLEQIEKLEQLRVLDNNYGIRLAIVPAHVAGIDTPEDYEAFVKRSKSHYQEPGARS